MTNPLPDLTEEQQLRIADAVRRAIIEQRPNMPGKSDAEIWAEIWHVMEIVAGIPETTWVLGPQHRHQVWRDTAGWTFEWDGDTFWHVYNPSGHWADDLIEEALNERYEDRKYGPFTVCGKVTR